MVKLPYFDALLESRARGRAAASVFERSVHWGFWQDPRAASGEEDDFRQAMQRLDDLLVEAAGVGCSHRVLDVGCGFGGTLDSINRRLSGMNLVGVNFDPRQLAVAGKQVSIRPQNRVEFVAADACALPFRRASFDRALAVESIFHFRSRLVFLKQVARVLKPGGVVALSDFVPWRHHGGGWLGRWLRNKIGRGYGRLGDDWRDGGYAAMAQAAGLVLEQDRDITSHTLPTYSFLMRLMRRDPQAAKTLAGPTRLLWWISALRLVRYRLLVLRKLPSAPHR